MAAHRTMHLHLERPGWTSGNPLWRIRPGCRFLRETCLLLVIRMALSRDHEGFIAQRWQAWEDVLRCRTSPRECRTRHVLRASVSLGGI